jgi:glycosyltransferase involved in cell wall biosynthesis
MSERSIQPPALAVLCDFPEETWPSMDLVGEMFLCAAAEGHGTEIAASRVCAIYRQRLARVPGLRASSAARNADRLLNRFVDYPRYLRRVRERFDLFHLCDHSYSQLLLELPADRTGVLCHDLDTFRCLLEPRREPRSPPFRAMARRILRGLQKARVVFHTTDHVRAQIERHGLLDPNQLVKAPCGIAPEFTAPDSTSNTEPIVLHVGSCIPRKRIDVLLDVFGALSRKRPELRLVQVGGEWTDEQRQQIVRHGIASKVTQMRGVARSTIADLYRRAAVVMMTSESEGFGLPAVEALACGAVVVASDIPTMREVGGEAVLVAPVGDVSRFVELAGAVVDDPRALIIPPREKRLAQASRFSWSAHADTIIRTYLSWL